MHVYKQIQTGGNASRVKNTIKHTLHLYSILALLDYMALCLSISYKLLWQKRSIKLQYSEVTAHPLWAIILLLNMKHFPLLTTTLTANCNKTTSPASHPQTLKDITVLKTLF